MSLKEKIESNRFAVLGEFEPPKGVDFGLLLKNANQIKGRLDALVIPEMANAVLKASSLGGCAFLQGHGIETVLQLCCRDRNRLALQADILAASALGVSNIMAVPGDDIRYGDHPHTRSVNDLDLLQLLDVIKTLQSGRDMAGIELSSTPRICMGSIINAGASGGFLDMELENLDKMVEAGVKFVITTPVFDIHRFQQFVKRIDLGKVALIPTILLLKSAGMARYIDRNLRHISIPPDIIREIQKAPDKPRKCIQIAGGLIRQIKEMKMAGVMISTMGWEDRLGQVLNKAGL